MEDDIFTWIGVLAWPIAVASLLFGLISMGALNYDFNSTQFIVNESNVSINETYLSEFGNITNINNTYINQTANLSGYWTSNGSSTATGNWNLGDNGITANTFYGDGSQLDGIKPSTIYGTSSNTALIRVVDTPEDTSFTSLTARVGDVLIVKFTAGTSSTTLRLRLNAETGNAYARLENLNSVPIVPAGSILTFVWDGTYWQVVGLKPPVETNIFSSYAQSNQRVGALTYRYKIVMEGSDGRLYPLLLTDGTGTTKTVSSEGFRLGGNILINSGGTNILSGNQINSDFLIFGNHPSTAFAFNGVTGFSTSSPLYLKGTVSTTDGLFYLDRSNFTSWYTQTLPTTEDGFVYIKIGVHKGGSWFLEVDKPIYEFKDGKLRMHGEKENTRSDNFKEYFGSADDASISYDGTNLVFNTSESGSAIAYFSNNISATGYITRTSVFDKSRGSALSLIKDVSQLIDSKGKIKHSEFYGYTLQEVTDFSKPVIEETFIDKCYFDDKDKDKKICYEEKIEKTTYPYKTFEEGVNIVEEIELLRQALVEQKIINQDLTSRITQLEDIIYNTQGTSIITKSFEEPRNWWEFWK
jgi:hypothetical protein